MSADHFLSKPTGRESIDPAALAYMRERSRGRVYSVVIDEFEKSGISQADLARRLHKGTDQISFRAWQPGNWTLDTVSDLFFAISGGEPTYGIQYPLDWPARDETSPNWLAPIAYCGAIPHHSPYTSGTVSAVSYAEVTSSTQISVEHLGNSTTVTYSVGEIGSPRFAVSIGGVADFTVTTSSCSPSIGEITGHNGFWTGAAGGGGVSGGSNDCIAQTSSLIVGGTMTATSGNNLNVECVNCFGFAASASDEDTCSASSVPMNGHQAMAAVR